MFKSLIVILALLPVASFATPITGASTLAPTTSQITFNDAGLPNGTAVTGQFTDQGATFSGLFYDDGFPPRANTDGALLFVFGAADVGIQFTSNVSRAFFALGSNAGSATFTSYLSGTIVESFTASIVNTALPPTNPSAQPNVFGFENSLFDEIAFTTSGSSGVSLDNVSFDVANVPVPATLALLGLGLVGLGFARRK